MQLWQHYPQAFTSEWFPLLLSEVQGKCASKLAHGRISCVFADNSIGNNGSSKLFSYSKLPQFTWDTAPRISEIKAQLQQALGINFDYCLVHIYPDGKANIGWQ